MKAFISVATLLSILVGTASAQEQFPVIKDVGGYWALPQAAMQPDKAHVYKAVIDATHAADKPTELAPGLEDAAALVNGLAAGGVPAANRKLAVVFYGPAANAVLNNESYRQKHGVDNPNLKVIAELRRAGVELFVCGQLLQVRKIDVGKVVPEVTIATDAFIVLVTYQNNGYARLAD
jgi:intracellular sulfur oxidation DsrE/DsrF family protein